MAHEKCKIERESLWAPYDICKLPFLFPFPIHTSNSISHFQSTKKILTLQKSAAFRRIHSGAFIENAENSIRSGVWKKRPCKAPQILARYSRLLRFHTGVSGGRNAGVYILILKIKTGGSFSFFLKNKCISAFP